MINYADPSRWVILQYKPGCGGKFLATAYSCIDRVASWDFAYQSGKISWMDHVNSLWNINEQNRWIDKEPQQPWGLPFFSRSMARGSNLSLSKFNSLADSQASEYFYEIWKQDLMLVDYYHRPELPVWWQQATVVKIDTDIHDPLWHQILLEKVCVWNEQEKTGTNSLDKPWSNECNEAKYNNQWRFADFEDKKSWLNWIINNDYRLNFQLDNPDIYLKDLFDFDCLNNHVKKLAKKLHSQYNVDNLGYLHNHWVGKHNIDILVYNSERK
jgi:hypothetical protein